MQIIPLPPGQFNEKLEKRKKTVLFEAYAMALIENEMPVNKVGYIFKEEPHRI